MHLSLALPLCNVGEWKGGAKLFPFVENDPRASFANVTMGVREGVNKKVTRIHGGSGAKWCRIVSVNSHPVLVCMRFETHDCL